MLFLPACAFVNLWHSSTEIILPTGQILSLRFFVKEINSDTFHPLLYMILLRIFLLYILRSDNVSLSLVHYCLKILLKQVWRGSTAGKMIDFHEADMGLIYDTIYGCHTTIRNDP